MDIVCLSSKNARSAGDALRDLDAMGVSWSQCWCTGSADGFLQVLNPDNPFLLVHSPLISNYDLSKMVDAHKTRREKDKDVIMTLGVGRGGK